MFDSLLDWLKTQFNNFIGFFQWIIDFLVDLVDSIGDFVINTILAVYDYICGNVAGLIDSISNCVPDVSAYLDTSGFSQAYYVCDRLFAIQIGFYLVVAFLTFCTTFITVKLILKLIPTIG